MTSMDGLTLGLWVACRQRNDAVASVGAKSIGSGRAADAQRTRSGRAAACQHGHDWGRFRTEAHGPRLLRECPAISSRQRVLTNTVVSIE
jgi:hypothetical protein